MGLWGRIKSAAGAIKDAVDTATGVVVDAVTGGVRSVGEGIFGTFHGMKVLIIDRDSSGYREMINSGAKLTNPIASVPAVIIAGLYEKIFGDGRSLNTAELAEARLVFADSINYDSIVIRDVLGIQGRAFTICNDICSAGATMEKIIHEMVHVWQYQNGGTDYIAASVYDQAGMLDEIYPGEPYKWQPFVAGGTQWKDLRAEHQAQLIQDAYASGFFAGEPFIFDGQNYDSYINIALVELRNKRGAP